MIAGQPKRGHPPVAGATGGNASIAADRRRCGRRAASQRRFVRCVGTASQSVSSALKSAGEAKTRPGRKIAPDSHGNVQRGPWPRDRRACRSSPSCQGAAKGLAIRSQLGLTRPPPPDRTLAVPDQHPGHCAQRRKMLPPTSIEILSGGWGSTPPTPSANSRRSSSVPVNALRCGLAEPDRDLDSGNQKSHWAISPATYAVREAGSSGRYNGRSSGTRPLRTRSNGSSRSVQRSPSPHPRIGRQQLPDPRFGLVGNRARCSPLILRRPIRSQRSL